jgi:hypothetical protein
MTPPRKASVDGLHGLPVVRGECVRVFVDGDMLRGVVSYDCDDGWVDVLEWTDEGHAMHNGEHFLTRRVFGKIEVREG